MLWFNEWIVTQDFGFTFISTLCIRFTYLLIRTCPLISSVAKYYQNLPSCKIDVFHCLYMSTVHVHHMCRMANQVRAHDVHHSCVACVHWQMCGCQNYVQQCMCMPFLYMVNMQTHACVRFKLSCTVANIAGF